MDDLAKMTRSRDHWRGVHRTNRERMKRLTALAQQMVETLEGGMAEPSEEPGTTYVDGLRAALRVSLDYAQERGLPSDIALGARRAAFQIEQLIREAEGRP
jgi:hypothetical protein